MSKMKGQKNKKESQIEVVGESKLLTSEGESE